MAMLTAHQGQSGKELIHQEPRADDRVLMGLGHILSPLLPLPQGIMG